LPARPPRFETSIVAPSSTRSSSASRDTGISNVTVGSSALRFFRRPSMAASSSSGVNARETGCSASSPSGSGEARAKSGRVVMWYGLGAHLSVVASTSAGMGASMRKRGKRRAPTRERRDSNVDFLRARKVQRTVGPRRGGLYGL